MAKPVPMLALPLKGDPDPRWVYEPKLDGIRVVVHKEAGVVSIYTRTMHELKTKLPHLETVFAQVPYDFTLDGEIIAVEKVVEVVGEQVPVSHFTTVNGILGSGASRAIASQKDAKLAFVVFDCLYAYDRDLTKLPDTIRRGAAQLVVDLLQTMTSDVMLVPRWTEANGNGLYEEIVALGGEGLMVKNPAAPYQVGTAGKPKRPANTWYKIKATETADVVIMGYKPGLGKYKGQIGAIEFGQYKNGKLVARSRCSGMTDNQRLFFTDHQSAYIGHVMEVKYFGRTGPERSFRHPNYVGLRNDKTPQECVWDD